MSGKSSQIQRINSFVSQIEKATSKFKNIVIVGDANLDSNKWNNDKFIHKKVAQILKDSLNANDLTMLDVS